MEEYQDRSLRGRVFRKLREDILSGVYQERDELREITIGEELGVSRTPVREALRQLELEGLVKIIPNKGAYVTGISRKDVADIYKIRSMLEGMCARWATEHITGKQIEELEEVLLLSEFHLRKKSEGQTEQVTELDGKFHKILYEASNSRILEHVLSDFHKYVQMARALCGGEKPGQEIHTGTPGDSGGNQEARRGAGGEAGEPAYHECDEESASDGEGRSRRTVI